jgi:Putative Flp pilus-assembly TadE/G-like
MRPRLRSRQSGQAIALAAGAMVAIVGAVAFVIDYGFFQEGRRELQSAADSAALAGVVFLPACPSAGAGCATPNNAQDAATLYIAANGPVARQLCGHPSVSVAPSATTNPGTYTNSVTQPGLYYTLTVSLSCNPGFSFGRIFASLTNEQIGASATAIVGSLGSVSCSAPVDVVGYQWGDTTNNFGYPPGLGNIPGATPGTLLPGETNYLQTSPGPPPTFTNTLVTVPSNSPSTSCPANPDCSPSFALVNNVGGYTGNSGGMLELCLNNSNCSGTDVRNWFAGNPCVALDVGSLQTTQTAPGDHTGPTAQGLIQRGYLDGGSGQSAICPQTLASVVDTTTWKVRQDTPATPCLIDLAILDYNDLVVNGRANVHINAFGTMFLQRFSGQTGNKFFVGVIVQTVHSGKVLSYRENATYATRLIR